MTTIATGNRRLLKLAAFLRTIPRKRFDYKRWVGLDWQGAPDLSCGTTACALGWATTMPTFRRLGLSLNRWAGPRLRNGAYGSLAAMELFEVTMSEALYLFYPDKGEYRATPKQVAAKIERFVRGRKP